MRNIAKFKLYLALTLFIVGTLSTLLVVPVYTYAVDPVPTNNVPPSPSGANIPPTGSNAKPQKTFTLSNPLKVDSVAGLVKSFVEIFSYVVIIIAVLALIWVGFMYIISRGDVAKMTQLKNWLFWIVIGVAVVIGARVIIEVIINTLAATGAIDQGVINSVRDANRR